MGELPLASAVSETSPASEHEPRTSLTHRALTHGSALGPVQLRVPSDTATPLPASLQARYEIAGTEMHRMRAPRPPPHRNRKRRRAAVPSLQATELRSSGPVATAASVVSRGFAPTKGHNSSRQSRLPWPARRRGGFASEGRGLPPYCRCPTPSRETNHAAGPEASGSNVTVSIVSPKMPTNAVAESCVSVTSP